MRFTAYTYIKVDIFMMCRFGIGSITQAQMALDIILLNGINARIIKLDAKKSANGCSYGIEAQAKDKSKIYNTLKKAKIKFSVI